MPARLMPSSWESRWISRSTRDVPHRVAPAATGRTPRRHQAHPVVGAQRLRVQSGQLGGDRDDVNRRVVVRTASIVITHSRAICRSVAAQVRHRLSVARSVSSASRPCPSTFVRHDDLDRDQQVALRAVAPGRAPAAHPQHPAVRRARRDLQGDRLAVEGRHLDLGAERGLGKVTGTVIVRLSPGAAEHRVRPHVHDDVAGRRPGHRCSPGAPLAFSRIRWPSSTPAGMRTWIVRVLGGPATAVAGRARVVDDQPAAAAVAARLGEREPALVSRLHAPCRCTVGQTRGIVPAFAPVPRQVGHGCGAGQPQRHGRRRRTASLEVERDLGLESAPRRGAARSRRLAGRRRRDHRTGRRARRQHRRRPPASPAGRRGRSRRQPPEPPPAAGRHAGSRRCRTATAPRRTPSRFVVGQHVVGLGDLLELLLGLRVAGVRVGVMLPGELAIGLLDLVLAWRVFRDAEDLVVVLLE